MQRDKIFKIIRTIKNVICWSLIAVLVTAVIIFLAARINGETPSLFGYSVFRVSSGSMEPELMTGDIILDKKTEAPEKLKVGDIITFEGTGKLSGMLVTHKIIKAPYLENGTLMLQTKGVANEIADEPISADCIHSVMVAKLSFLNGLYSFFLSPWGLITIIALIVLVFFDEAVAVVKILSGRDREKEPEDIGKIIERLQKEDKGDEE